MKKLSLSSIIVSAFVLLTTTTTVCASEPAVEFELNIDFPPVTVTPDIVNDIQQAVQSTLTAQSERAQSAPLLAYQNEQSERPTAKAQQSE